jgi:hypothetical protein
MSRDSELLLGHGGIRSRVARANALPLVTVVA